MIMSKKDHIDTYKTVNLQIEHWLHHCLLSIQSNTSFRKRISKLVAINSQRSNASVILKTIKFSSSEWVIES